VRAGEAAVPRLCPHSLQNLVPGGCDEPHPWHIMAAWRAPPHSRQNFASAEFW